jgi:hypothetical protein
MSSLAGNEVVVIGPVRAESGHAAAFRVVDWLGLAAAPTFAIMALLTGVLDGRAGYPLHGNAASVAACRNDPYVPVDERLPRLG